MVEKKFKIYLFLIVFVIISLTFVIADGGGDSPATKVALTCANTPNYCTNSSDCHANNGVWVGGTNCDRSSGYCCLEKKETNFTCGMVIDSPGYYIQDSFSSTPESERCGPNQEMKILSSHVVIDCSGGYPNFDGFPVLPSLNCDVNNPDCKAIVIGDMINYYRDVTIKDCKFRDFHTAIEVQSIREFKLLSSTLVNVNDAVNVNDSTNTTIEENHIRSINEAINFYSSEGGIIRENIVYGNISTSNPYVFYFDSPSKDFLVYNNMIDPQFTGGGGNDKINWSLDSLDCSKNNIVGGDCIGGNYWGKLWDTPAARSSGNAFDPDQNNDGILDSIDFNSNRGTGTNDPNPLVMPKCRPLGGSYQTYYYVIDSEYPWTGNNWILLTDSVLPLFGFNTTGLKEVVGCFEPISKRFTIKKYSTGGCGSYDSKETLGYILNINQDTFGLSTWELRAFSSSSTYQLTYLSQYQTNYIKQSQVIGKTLVGETACQDYFDEHKTVLAGPQIIEGDDCNDDNLDNETCLNIINNCTWTPPRSASGHCCGYQEIYDNTVGCVPIDQTAGAALCTNVFSNSFQDIMFDFYATPPNYCAKITCDLSYGLWDATEIY